MSDYRRNFVPVGTFFFTVVTERRSPHFTDECAQRLLGDSMRKCQANHPFTGLATVLLPDHLHALWELPAGDDNYSLRWKLIKSDFTRHWLAQGGREQPRRRSRVREKRRGVWQRRYWEHTIRDVADLQNHFDYIHFNPVKHRYAARPRDWLHSSFHRWVASGHYDINWGAGYTSPDLPGNAGE